MDVLTWIRHALGLDRRHGKETVLIDDFVRKAQQFYPDPEALWEPVALPSSNRVWYMLKNDATRALVVERMKYLDRELKKVWTRLRQVPVPRRPLEMDNLRRFFEPDEDDGVARLVQKPSGGYDVRAYAHDAWIFVEIPTFASVEQGTDGVNVTEAKRRTTLLHIILHELAHVAGHWKHDDKHRACVAWLTKYID